MYTNVVILSRVGLPSACNYIAVNGKNPGNCVAVAFIPQMAPTANDITFKPIPDNLRSLCIIYREWQKQNGVLFDIEITG